jgi:CRISPR/Cas system-associated exonuclease Cas4 (RecB family)
MATLPASVVDPVADAIFAHYKAKYGVEAQRPYLGASAIGKPCLRQHWYSFRWSKPAEFSGRLYRVFQSGHLQEPRVYADLRSIGCEVYDINPSTGKQFGWSEPSTGHHFRGNADGIVIGLPQAPKAPHILEIKTASDKYFREMQKSGVKQAKPEHWAQMQSYMHWSLAEFGEDGCKRAIYIVVNKDNDDIYTERLEYDAEAAQAIIDKALAIITAVEPPVGISTDPTWYECKFCDYHSICHGTDVPAPTCRSCAHITPKLDGNGNWSCHVHAGKVSDNIQRNGCAYHRYIPILLAKSAKPMDVDGDAVVYQMADGQQFINGDPKVNPKHFASAEIHAAKDKAVLVDKEVMKIRVEFDGIIV